jgi:D-arabinitol dehydrogenase (NADP+)
MIVDGGFAEYCAYPQGKVFHVNNLNDVDATLLEPASCAAHGLEKIAPKVRSLDYQTKFSSARQY